MEGCRGAGGEGRGGEKEGAWPGEPGYLDQIGKPFLCLEVTMQGPVGKAVTMLSQVANTYAGLFGNGHPNSSLWMSTLKTWKGGTAGGAL